MAKFVFKLDGVLRHRKRLEQHAQRDVAEAQANVNSLTEELRELNAGLTAAADELRTNHLVGTIDVRYLTAHRRYTADVTQRGTMLMQKLAVAQRDVETRRAGLMEAAKQRKVLEKLRDKHELRWKEEQARREQSLADDEIGTWFEQVSRTEAEQTELPAERVG